MANSAATRPPAFVPEPISGARMIVALGAIGVLAAILLVFTYLGTLPAIERNRAEALERAIFEVLPGAERKAAFSELDGALVPAGGDAAADNYYAGYDATGALVGVAIQAEGQGFADVLRVLYGYSPRCRCIVGFKVMESKETPGLGDKIETDPVFTANFEALDVALNADGAALRHPQALVKRGAKTEPWQIESITGATISARAVTRILDASSAASLPLIERNLEVLEHGGSG